MVQLLIAIALSANTYTGITTVIGGVSTIAGKTMTGGTQLYQPQNLLYFRTATTQWSSTDEISLKMAGAAMAPVATAQKLVLSDTSKILTDVDVVTSTKDAYKAAVKQLQLDTSKNDFGKIEADAVAVDKAEFDYDAAVKKERVDRGAWHRHRADVTNTSATAIAHLSSLLDGLVSSGKAKTF